MSSKESFRTKQVEGKNVKYWVWCKIPDEHILTEEHIGKRVYVAGYLKSEKFILKKIHHAGEKYWPEDGYDIEDKYTKRCFSKPEVRLHPFEYIKKRDKKKIVFKKKIKIEDISKNIKDIKKLKRKTKKKNEKK